jgi:SAM-dependent methyltransferase
VCDPKSPVLAPTAILHPRVGTVLPFGVLTDDFEVDALLAEQVAYYRARAPGYDRWLQRLGLNQAYLTEVARLDEALASFCPSGDVLELAAGTGMWTGRLASFASTLTAVDASPEALSLNRAKLASLSTPVRYVEADIFAWEPDRRYDVVCFSFWLSHVPISRFESFWSLVDRALLPCGRFFFVDNALPRDVLRDVGWQFARRGSLVEEVDALTDLASDVSIRRLNGVREYRIVKRFWEPAELRKQLSRMGWLCDVRATDWAFIYGQGHVRPNIPLSLAAEHATDSCAVRCRALA